MKARKNRLKGGFVGAFMKKELVQAINDWVDSGPERSLSVFLRSAAREKLRRDGVDIYEDQTNDP